MLTCSTYITYFSTVMSQWGTLFYTRSRFRLRIGISYILDSFFFQSSMKRMFISLHNSPLIVFCSRGDSTCDFVAIFSNRIDDVHILIPHVYCIILILIPVCFRECVISLWVIPRHIIILPLPVLFGLLYSLVPWYTFVSRLLCSGFYTWSRVLLFSAVGTPSV